MQPRSPLPLLPLPPADFGYSEAHAQIQASARRWLAEHASAAELRRLETDPVGYAPSTLPALAELGWLELGCPADGAMDHLSVALLAEEQGRRLLPSPWASTIVAAALLAQAGTPEQRERWLPPLVAGQATLSVAFQEPRGVWHPEQLRSRAVRQGDGWQLTGSKLAVAWGQRADALLLPTRSAEGLELFVVERGALEVVAEATIDSTRRSARLGFTGLELTERERLEPSAAGAALGGALRLARLLLAAELVGVSEAVLALTRDYACLREQFGKPIGAFQAVKHPLVDVLTELELSRSLVLSAALACGGPDEAGADTLVAMARWHSAEGALRAVQHGVQLHGGYGFTKDCDVHFYFKRALASRGLLGTNVELGAELARRLFGGS